MPSNDLLPYIFSNTRLPIAVQVARWMQESTRFRLFAETYRDKIRKKVRGITDARAYGDLQTELEAAYFLSREPKFQVEYERYGTGKQRGPDFSVTYKTHIRFDVEVTRLRGALEPGKLANAVCTKLEQLPPSMMNVLVLAADDVASGEGDVSSAAGQALESGLRLLQERAEHKDDGFFARRGFLGARDFFRYYGRLSAIRLVTPNEPAILQLQPQARHPLPPDLVTLLRR